MRAFIVLCLIASACADVSSLPGYNYGSEGIGGGDNFGPIEGDGGIGVDGVGGIGGVDGDGDVGGSDGVGGLGDIDNNGYEKEFYTFKANENEFDQPDVSQQIANSLKKNLKVVFVKGPENSGLEDAALALAKHASDQKNDIYVLTKQVDIGDLANKLNAANKHNRNKPEVHFVKYRTPGDAHNAQNQIQNQYNSLGGSSQSHDGGVAPVLDFSSKKSAGPSSQYGGYTNAGPISSYVPPSSSYVPPASAPVSSYIPPVAPGNSYIPPSIFRRFRL